MSDTARTLRFAGVAKVRVVGAPRGNKPLVTEILGDASRARTGGDAIIAFAAKDTHLDAALEAISPYVLGDRPSWIAYPKKSGPLRSDLDRDLVNRRGHGRGMRAVAQIALDDTWSALRFRLA
jgi:hypothetical protein